MLANRPIRITTAAINHSYYYYNSDNHNCNKGKRNESGKKTIKKKRNPMWYATSGAMQAADNAT